MDVSRESAIRKTLWKTSKIVIVEIKVNPVSCKNDKLFAMAGSARRMILDIVYNGGASHIGSSFSVVEILVAIYKSIDIDKIKNQSSDRDRVIVSKGHSAAALYATLYEFGLMSKSDLETYHTNNSLLSGHVSHFIPNVEHSTGALGHGLSVAVGVCIGLKSKGLVKSRVYVVVGDGELHEGSNWEAMMLAGHLKLDNLCVLVDNNQLSGIGKTSICCSLEPYADKFESFRFSAFEVDGHNEEQIFSTIRQAEDIKKPCAIVCHTVKGKGVSFMANDNVWHYRPPNAEARQRALAELVDVDRRD